MNFGRSRGAGGSSPAPEKIDGNDVGPVKNFCGRKRETDAIASKLRRRRWRTVRVVVLDGMAGSGKTTLARQVAYQHRDRFETFVEIDLKGSTKKPTSPTGLLQELLRRLSISTAGLDDETLYRRYHQAMASKSLLILLDDAADAEQIRKVVEFTGSSVVLVTSRVELRGLHELVRIGVGSFKKREALELLSAKISPSGAERVAAEPDAAASIVRRCGGLPLAIHLVGGRVSGDSRSLASLEELDADLASLGLSGIAERESDTARSSARTMRGVFNGVYRRLRPELQCMFRLMGGDLRDIDAETAGALADVSERDAVELLRDLDAHRLAERVRGTQVRYRLHDLLWEFAQELAAEDPAEIVAAARRLSALRLRQVEDLVAGAHYGTASETSGAAAAQVQRAFAHEDYVTCWRLVANLAELYEVIGFPDNWPTLHKHGTAAAVAIGDERARIAMLLAEGAHRSFRWQWTELLELLEDFADTGTATNTAKARVSTMRSHAYAAIGDPDRAVTEARRALSYSLDDRCGQTRALVALGEAHRERGALEESAARLTEAIDSVEMLPVERSRALCALAATLVELGRPDEAAAALSEAVEIDMAADDGGHLFVVLVRMADLCLPYPGGHGPAMERLRPAFELRLAPEFFRQPKSGQTAAALLTMAECYLQLGQPIEADYAWQQANHLKVAALETRQLVIRGTLAIAEGRVVEAAQALDLALTSSGHPRSTEEARLRARAAVLLGDVYGGLGNHALAADYYKYAEQLTGEETGRLAQAQAAIAGSSSARAGFRRRVPKKWPRWLLTVLAVLTCLPTFKLMAHDTSGIRVTPVSNSTVLVACTIGAMVAARMRPYGAGVLMGYLSTPPVALGLVLITSEQVRARGTAGMLIDYALFTVAAAVAVWRSRRIAWVWLMSLLVIEVGMTGALPTLWTRPVAPSVWQGVGVALIVLGAAWLPVTTLSHPAVHRQTQVVALLAAPIAGGGLALLLGFGLGRQTYMLWPGSLGSDWRLALLGLSTATACVCAGLIGPPRLSSGILSGLAWFWGINGVLLGMAHADSDVPTFWHPGGFWHWLTNPSIMPLLCLLAVGVLGFASTETGGFYPQLGHDRPPLPMPKGLPERLRAARRVRIRMYAAGALVALAALHVLSVALDDPKTPERVGALFWVAAWLFLAALVHPDIRPGNGPRWLSVAVLLVIAMAIAFTNARHIGSHGWSRGTVAGLMEAAAAFIAVGIVAPYRTIPVGRSRIDRARIVVACTWAALVSVVVAVLADASDIADVLRSVAGGAGGLGASLLYLHLKRRRATDSPQNPPPPA
ncbi:NB-ARC domain-containing protein [Streptomyces ehimensis]|uniref:NB-ARC domain-containing protein n=1 Tax=Streptomyces ehimensis TaxID=68195 RepID=A0ABV9BU56_9ACTN